MTVRFPCNSLYKYCICGTLINRVLSLTSRLLKTQKIITMPPTVMRSMANLFQRPVSKSPRKKSKLEKDSASVLSDTGTQVGQDIQRSPRVSYLDYYYDETAKAWKYQVRVPLLRGRGSLYLNFGRSLRNPPQMGLLTPPWTRTGGSTTFCERAPLNIDCGINSVARKRLLALSAQCPKGEVSEMRM